MKYREIKLENNKSVLVDESKSADIKEGSAMFTHEGIEFADYDGYPFNNGGNEFCYKIIATINHSIDLDVPMVVVEDEVETLAEHSIEVQEGTYTPPHKTTYKHGFIDGFKAAQQKGGYSEEDLWLCYVTGKTKGSYYMDNEFKDYIQSLTNQEYIELEMFDVECSCKSKEDMSKCSINCCKSNSRNFPRIKTNRVAGQLMAYQKK